jgi:aryl-alcohol dehydrogenase-like predicted oxidoreductase
VSISEVGFGTGDNAGGLVYAETAQQIALVERALELGVNFFDSSPDYGKGLGEANLGRILRDLRAHDAMIATKVEIMPEEMHRIGDKVEQSINDSLLRLRRDHVHFLLLHNPSRSVPDPSIRVWTPLPPEVILGEVVPAMQRARQAGKVGRLGLACERADSASVRTLLDTGLFSLAHMWFNLANPSPARTVEGLPANETYDGFFAAARDNGVGVGIIRPLAGGALTSAIAHQGAQGRHPVSGGYYRDHPEQLEPERARGAGFVGLDRADRPLSAAALSYVLSRPEVTTVVGGFSDVAHLEEAASVSDTPALSADELAEIDRLHDAGFGGA